MKYELQAGHKSVSWTSCGLMRRFISHFLHVFLNTLLQKKNMAQADRVSLCDKVTQQTESIVR